MFRRGSNETVSDAVLSPSDSPVATISPPAFRRLRPAQPPTHYAPTKESSAATPSPIPIRGCKETTPVTEYSIWEPAQHFCTNLHQPIHSRMDNVTDYCWPGAHGWEFAREGRREREEERVGKILGGQWPGADSVEKSQKRGARGKETAGFGRHGVGRLDLSG